MENKLATVIAMIVIFAAATMATNIAVNAFAQSDESDG